MVTCRGSANPGEAPEVGVEGGSTGGGSTGKSSAGGEGEAEFPPLLSKSRIMSPQRTMSGARGSHVASRIG